MSGDVPVHYWKELLFLSTKAAAEAEEEGGVVEHGPPKPMDADNRKWLETVMSDLVEDTDPSKQLKKAMDGLKVLATNTHLSEEDEDKIQDLAYKMDDILQFADFTSQFVNDGGLIILERFLNYKESLPVQLTFADSILTMAENNPPAQDALVNGKLLEKILIMVQNKDAPEKLRLKLLGSISATVRSHFPSFDAFMNLNGSQIFSSMVADESNSVKIAAKAARIITTISYTLVDCPARSKLLCQDVVRNYVTLVGRNTLGDANEELQYIREFLQQSIGWDEVSESQRDDVINALQTELSRNQGDEVDLSVRQLIQKYTPLKVG